MYNLTDYTETELRMLSIVISNEIDDLVLFLDKAEAYLPAGIVYNDITKRDRLKLSVLREHHIHLLSALEIVKRRNLVEAN